MIFHQFVGSALRLYDAILHILKIFNLDFFHF